MHEEFDDNFDLFVKSMMEDAEEEIPAGLWDRIESRLPQKSPAVIWWKRLGLVVAACAALAFILTGILNKSDHITIVSQDEQRTTAQAIVHSSEPAVQQTEIGEKTAIREVQTRASTVEPLDVPQRAEETMVSQNDPISAAIERQEDMPDEKPVEKSDEKPGAGLPKQTYEQEWNSFLFQEQKSQKSTKRLSTTLLGSFGANDNVNNKGQENGRTAAPTILGDARTGIIESGESFYSIPLSFGVGARMYLTDRLSAGIGINFSILTRSFTGTYQKSDGSMITERIPDADVTHKMLYIGIPVNLYYDILQTNLLRFYTYAGGAAEKCLYNKYNVLGDSGEASLSESVNGMQWSAALGLGIQFNLSEHTGLYLDPNARYYFDCNQPKSIRTQKPFTFNIEAGIRFNL